MKKGLFVSAFVVLLGAIGLYTYLIQQGEFEKWSHPWVPIEFFDEHEAMYFGYSMTFEGYGHPTIENIYLFQKDGMKIDHNNEEIKITPFVDKSDTIGTMNGEGVEEEGIELVPVENFKMKEKKFRLALKVELLNKSYDKDVHTLVVEYNHLGMSRKQEIAFDGLFIESEHVFSIK